MEHHEKVSQFLENQLESITQKGKSYIQDLQYFLEKIKNIDTLPGNAKFVTAGVVGLYPKIPHYTSLSTLKETQRSLGNICDVNFLELLFGI